MKFPILSNIFDELSKYINNMYIITIIDEIINSCRRSWFFICWSMFLEKNCEAESECVLNTTRCNQKKKRRGKARITSFDMGGRDHYNHPAVEIFSAMSMAMFGKNDGPKEHTASDTIIGASVKVDGKFNGKGNIVVEGRVNGSMRTHHDLHVKEGAFVKADLDAKNIFIAGEVHGNVRAAEHLDLAASARVVGNVEAKLLAVAGGAILNGKCTMIAEGTAAEPRLDEEEERARAAKQPKNGNGKKTPPL